MSWPAYLGEFRDGLTCKQIPDLCYYKYEKLIADASKYIFIGDLLFKV